MIFYDKENGIYGFSGEYRWLSNFYPVRIELEGLAYPSVEHAYQALKTLDKDVRNEFTSLSLKAGEAKYKGRSIQLRKNWNDQMKLLTMRRCLEKKFEHDELRNRLIGTGNRYIEETNRWNDKFWGICDGKGSNHLGSLLMSIREELSNE